MRVERLVRVLPDGRDQLSPLHFLAAPDFDRLEMSVERANFSSFVIFVEDALDDDDIAPQPAAVLGEDHAAVGHGEYVLSEVGVAAARAVPVFAGVNSHAVFFGEPRGDVPSVVSFARGLVGVRAFAVRIAYGEVEAVGGRDLGVEEVVERITPFGVMRRRRRLPRLLPAPNYQERGAEQYGESDWSYLHFPLSTCHFSFVIAGLLPQIQ